MLGAASGRTSGHAKIATAESFVRTDMNHPVCNAHPAVRRSRPLVTPVSFRIRVIVRRELGHSRAEMGAAAASMALGNLG